MNGRKETGDLYTEQLMRIERSNFAYQKENHALRLDLMRTEELLQLKARYPEEPAPSSTAGKIKHRLKASSGPFDPAMHRIDLTFGMRAVFDEELLAMQRSDESQSTTTITILLDATNADDRLLNRTLASILDQTYRSYELCVTDHSSKKNFHIGKILQNASKASGGKVKVNSEPTGEWLTAIRSGDFLHPSALYLMSKQMTEDTDFVYADEAGFDEYPQNVRRPYPLYESGYDKSGSESASYTVRAFAVRKDKASGEGLHSDKTGYKLLKEANNPKHIPAVLYYSRGGDIAFEQVAEEISVTGKPLVSILICNKDHNDILERCISSIEANTTWDNYEIIICENNSTEDDIKTYYESLESDAKVKVITWEGENQFNFAALNNFAAKCAGGEYLILLNNDTEVIDGGWIEALLAQTQKEGTAVTGSLLIYPDNTIQHAGMCISGGNVFHLGMHENAAEPGYLGYYMRAHEVASVTAACMMVRRSVWDELEGLDEEFRIAYNDVDFCLRAREAGYKIGYAPGAKLYHHEGKSRGFRRLYDKDIKAEEAERRMFISKHPATALYDPYFNPSFLPGGCFMEKLPTEEDRKLGKALVKYAGLPFLIDEVCSPDTARQVLYVASVI